MELRQVRYFLAICEHGGFSRAAEQFGVTQPALTKAIKQLEDEVGGVVFHREGRRLVLSDLGQRIRPHLQRLAAEQQAALAAAQNFRLLRQAPLRIGVLPSIGPAGLGAFLKNFIARHPSLELALSEGPSDRLARQLEAAEIDLALANPAVGFGDTFRGEALYVERYLVVLSPGHPLAARAAIRLRDLDGEDYVDRLACELREMAMQLLGQCGVRLYARCRSEREDWIQNLVHAGLGFALLPEHALTLATLQARPLVEPPLVREVHAIEVRGRPRSPAVTLFLDEARVFDWPSRARAAVPPTAGEGARSAMPAADRA
jgi:DNA-binding transcriptional LysR family regulator